MRATHFLLLLLTLACVAGCPSGVERSLTADEDGAGNGSGAGGGLGSGAMAPNCSVDADCVPAGPRCCDCPTHSVPSTDPAQSACSEVDCGTMSCGSPTEAACVSGYCTLVCSPVSCDPSISCPSGFATDANGCLTCECAGTADLGGECAIDTDCARVRDDCCGCENGGADTAVPVAQASSYDLALGCPASPTCPGGNTCVPDLAARCVQGYCDLVSGPLPANACGRADLPACAGNEFCYVNANDQATMHGVGVCQP